MDDQRNKAPPLAPHDIPWRPLRQRSAPELRATAQAYGRMAATATTPEIRDALLRLSRRFAAVAAEKEASG